MRVNAQKVEPISGAALSEVNLGDSSETEMIFFALAQAVEQRDLHTATHCERLAFISVAMGMVSGLDRDDLLIL